MSWKYSINLTQGWTLIKEKKMINVLAYSGQYPARIFLLKGNNENTNTM